MFDQSLLADIPIKTWVALSADESRVVAFDPDLSKAIEKAEQAGEPLPVIVGNPGPITILGGLFCNDVPVPPVIRAFGFDNPGNV